MNDDQIHLEVDKIFIAADQDGNGEIDYSEWQVATINKYDILQEEKLKGAFALFDKVIYIQHNSFRTEVALFQLKKSKKF